MTDTPRSDNRPTDGADDDQHWLDLVAGRTVDDAHNPTRREAAWLRAALLSYRAEAPEGTPAPAGPRADQLVARARAAGVLPPVQDVSANHASHRAPAGSPQRPAPRTSRPVWAWPLAAVVAGLGVIGVLHWTGLPGHPGAADDGASQDGTLRGATVHQRRSGNPVADRDRLLLQLRDVGLDAQAFERLGRPGIDVELPVPLPAAQRDALARLHITAPAGPSLRIEFMAAAAASGP